MMNICIIGQTALLDDHGWLPCLQSANTYIVTHADIHYTSHSPGRFALFDCFVCLSAARRETENCGRETEAATGTSQAG